MTDFKKLSCLVWGIGLECGHVERLAKDFSHVFYFSPWQEQQKYVTYAVGKGLAPNIEKILHFDDYVDKADLMCFMTLGEGDRAKRLRNQGKLVFGGGDGEKLEEYRFKFRQIQKKLGLPTQKTESVTGLKALEEYVRKNPKSVIKLNLFREDKDSFVVRPGQFDLDMADMKASLGPYANTFEFMVEERLDSVCETGMDGFFNGKDWLWPILWGFTVNYSYLGRVAERKDVPKPILEVMEKLGTVFKKLDYRGCVSTEHRVMKDGTHYLIDITMRVPTPMGLIYADCIKNYSDVIYGVSKGETVKPEFGTKYVGCLAVRVSNGKEAWNKVDFPEQLRPHMQFESICKEGKGYYSVKGHNNLGALTASGNTPKSVVDRLKEYIKHVQVNCMDTDMLELLRVGETIQKAKTVGIEI